MPFGSYGASPLGLAFARLRINMGKRQPPYPIFDRSFGPVTAPGDPGFQEDPRLSPFAPDRSTSLEGGYDFGSRSFPVSGYPNLGNPAIRRMAEVSRANMMARALARALAGTRRQHLRP